MEDVSRRELEGNCFASGNYVHGDVDEEMDKAGEEALAATEMASDRGVPVSRRTRSIIKPGNEDVEIEELTIPDIDVNPMAAGDLDEDESVLDI